jgi:hypothetical protein
VRTVTVGGFAELAPKFFSKSFGFLSRAIALVELSGTRESMSFGRIVTDTDRQIQMERTYCYGMGRF